MKKKKVKDERSWKAHCIHCGRTRWGVVTASSSDGEEVTFTAYVCQHETDFVFQPRHRSWKVVAK